MKTRILIIFILMLSAGCASLKYPNWEKVSIEKSVDGKPCITKGVNEQCHDSRCDLWFKKRATLVNANTVVIRSNLTGRYFQCENGLPPYKDPDKFNEEDYKHYLKSGINTVRGQAFLTQRGGGVVTCAGKSVLMYPNTEYFTGLADVISWGFISENQLASDEKALLKVSQCDAQGNFEFYKIPAGNWVIKTNVSWDVYSVKSIGSYYYTDNERQGGGLIKKVIVQDGEINKFIISE